MRTQSRIPIFKGLSKDQFQVWCNEMAEAGLIFHFEDKPEDIMKYNEPLFTKAECHELNVILNTVFKYTDYDPMECALIAVNTIINKENKD
jgi:hypothetical protein